MKTRTMDTRFTIPASEVEAMVKSYIRKKYGKVTKKYEWPEQSFGALVRIAPAFDHRGGSTAPATEYEILFSRRDSERR